MGANDVHTADNAVPSLAGTELGGLLEDLAGFHPGIDLIRDGIRLLALDRHSLDRTQTLSAVLAGSTDGTDILTAIGLLVARLTNPESNPALRGLTFEQQKNTQKAGEALVFDLADPDLHQHAADAAGHIHTD
jgi:hypothetical protein